ncbi:hypothetical protein B0F90DRAFT_1320300 [Multifurca ochricompacta]|uniref:Uncharacterized protein n=1 Tax=Multifurca ochricompacta TaxID=376703 RepID=A0AAD4M747_9AGAM|nr:hypothetical protein B0F90DRAFT_1320300 [Multifurca ochricompacta]
MTCRHDRTTSGIRNAEMKWTNHGNLSVYGVRLEGWPGSIPMQNPSTLSTSQNRELRDAIINGTLKFCCINGETSLPSDGALYGPGGTSSDLSWAISEEFNTPIFIESQVSNVTNAERIAHRKELTNYFPGVTVPIVGEIESDGGECEPTMVKVT